MTHVIKKTFHKPIIAQSADIVFKMFISKTTCQFHILLFRVTCTI